MARLSGVINVVDLDSGPTLLTQGKLVELALQNLQRLEEIRSISRFGLSVVTVVFEEDLDIYLARQLVSEHLAVVEESIPPGFR